MIFEEFYSFDLECVVVRVNKVRAKKLFCEGKNIFLQPCNMLFDGRLKRPYEVDKESSFNGYLGRYYDTPETLFDVLVEEYTYYNCDNEFGRYPRFFIRKSDLS